MNRLVKSIKDNAISDRKSASELFQECKEALSELGGRVQFDEQGNSSVDSFAKVITSSTQALNQMGAANEKLLKLAQTMQKYQLKEMDLEGKSGPGSQELKGSVFSNLTSMLHKNDNA